MLHIVNCPGIFIIYDSDIYDSVIKKHGSGSDASNSHRESCAYEE